MSDETSEDKPMPMTAPKPEGAAPSKLAQRLEKARIERGVTQKQLADRLHVRQSMVSMFETGEDEVSEELATRMKSWIDSGAGAAKAAPRGPRGNYDVVHQSRSTIKGRE